MYSPCLVPVLPSTKRGLYKQLYGLYKRCTSPPWYKNVLICKATQENKGTRAALTLREVACSAHACANPEETIPSSSPFGGVAGGFKFRV